MNDPVQTPASANTPCPACGATNSMPCPAAHTAGIIHIETKSTGVVVGLGADGLIPALGAGTTKGTQQTNVAILCAPPTPGYLASPALFIIAKTIFAIATGLFGIMALSGLFIGEIGMSVMFGIIAGLCGAGYYAMRQEARTIPALRAEQIAANELKMAEWKASLICTRCHHLWLPTGSLPDLPPTPVPSPSPLRQPTGNPMALKKCKECGNEVSTKAASCPKCGAVIKKKMGCLGYSGVCIGGALVLSVMVANVIDAPTSRRGGTAVETETVQSGSSASSSSDTSDSKREQTPTMPEQDVSLAASMEFIRDQAKAFAGGGEWEEVMENNFKLLVPGRSRSRDYKAARVSGIHEITVRKLGNGQWATSIIVYLDDNLRDTKGRYQEYVVIADWIARVESWAKNAPVSEDSRTAAVRYMEATLPSSFASPATDIKNLTVPSGLSFSFLTGRQAAETVKWLSVETTLALSEGPSEAQPQPRSASPEEIQKAVEESVQKEVDDALANARAVAQALMTKLAGEGLKSEDLALARGIVENLESGIQYNPSDLIPDRSMLRFYRRDFIPVRDAYRNFVDTLNRGRATVQQAHEQRLTEDPEYKATIEAQERAKQELVTKQRAEAEAAEKERKAVIASREAEIAAERMAQERAHRELVAKLKEKERQELIAARKAIQNFESEGGAPALPSQPPPAAAMEPSAISVTNIPALVPLAVVPPEAPARPATLHVSTLVSGANVELNGDFKGTTPCSITGLAAGEHRLRVYGNGVDESTVVVLRSGWVSRVRTPLPKPARLELLQLPAQGRITVDGKPYAPGMLVMTGTITVKVISSNGDRAFQADTVAGRNVFRYTDEPAPPASPVTP